MRLFILAALLGLASSAEQFSNFMAGAFYPALLGILIIASLGIPIPEDIPLIAAGVVLHEQPEIASWHGTILVALLGIMSGDIVLYSLGRRWGRDVVNHRSVNWIVTPERYTKVVEKFHQRGSWFVFFGRFVMGIRAAMCIVAGATHFPFWRFLLADLAGALLSAPLFIVLGYIFAESLPTLQRYVTDVQGIVLISIGVGTLIYIVYRIRRRRKRALSAGDAGP